MKKLVCTLLAMGLVVVCLGSCVSVPKEKTDELDGTKWKCWYKSNPPRSGSYEIYEFFHGGKYAWAYVTASSGTVESKKGTYTIEEDKIILIRNGLYSDIKTTATFSSDRQNFSYSDRVFERELSWAEMIKGEK